MPETGFFDTGSEINPYEGLEEDATSDTETQEDEQEVSQISDLGVNLVEEDSSGEAQISDLSDSQDGAEEDLLARFERLEKRIHDKDAHIGTLENDNKTLRDLIDRIPVAEKPEKKVEPKVDPFDNPDTVQRMQEAFEKDPIETMRAIAQHYRDEAFERVQETVTPLVTESVEDKRISALQARANADLTSAAELPGGETIVGEFVSSRGSQGQLAAAMANKAKALRDMGMSELDAAEAAFAPGSIRSMVAEIIVSNGLQDPDTPRTTSGTAKASPASRPKARNKTTPGKSTEEEKSEEDIFGDAIVNSGSTRQKIAQILG